MGAKKLTISTWTQKPILYFPLFSLRASQQSSLENLLKFKMEGMTTKTQRKRKGKRKRRKRAKILRRKRRRYCCTTLSTLYTTITISLNKITPPHCYNTLQTPKHNTWLDPVVEIVDNLFRDKRTTRLRNQYLSTISRRLKPLKVKARVALRKLFVKLSRKLLNLD